MAIILVCLAWLRDSVLFAVAVGWLVYWLVKLVAGTESKKEENVAPIPVILAAKKQAVASTKGKETTEEDIFVFPSSSLTSFPEIPKSTQPYVPVPADEFAPKPVAGATEEVPTEEELRVEPALTDVAQQAVFVSSVELAVAGTEEEDPIEKEVRGVPDVPETTQQTVSVPVDEFALKAGFSTEDLFVLSSSSLTSFPQIPEATQQTISVSADEEENILPIPAFPEAAQQPVSVSETEDDGVLKVFFATIQGTSKKLAGQFKSKAEAQGLKVKIVDLSSYDPEDLGAEKNVAFIVPTYEDGKPPPAALWFFQWLGEAAVDERVGSAWANTLRFAVFGLGNSQYEEHYNEVGKTLDKHLHAVGGHRVLPFCAGDEDNDTISDQFSLWTTSLFRQVGKKGVSTGGLLEEEVEEDEDSPSEFSDSEEEGEEEDDAAGGSEDGLDMEDIGGKVPRRNRKPKTDQSTDVAPLKKPEMVTPKLRKALTKQGYKILGTHSGVKICRWTKSMLRGRGGCYKHTFYGIESHRCMEATPSLACANKCVFCWRHHTNPVGKEWKWDLDPPLQLVDQAVEAHKGMVKQMKGVPGVLEERLAEGMEPRHCALSLVGEPIMYPEINTLVDELHRRHISTFLVTNAQWPDKIRSLHPITQLYVSVDAATEDTLKEIDRPLFKDFWQRLKDSLSSLKAKRQRTVYRLTLVKGWNTEEVKNYASMVSLGDPDFIEIKGVTYCGSTDTSSLTMKNVPFFDEVTGFADTLCAELNGEYGLACAHEHSLCVLLARKDAYLKEGVWHTWIDYDKFQDLVQAGEPFESHEYMKPTPSWAMFGSEEKGFNPAETRFRKVRNHPGKSAKLIESPGNIVEPSPTF